MTNDENSMTTPQNHAEPKGARFRHWAFIRHSTFCIRHLLPLLLFSSAAHALELPATKPSTGTIHRWVALPSTLAPWQQVTLYAKVTGYIRKITVDIGDAVKAGQVLAEIEVPELLTDRAKAKAELDLAQLEFDRATEAAKRAPDLVVKQMIDTVKGKLEIARANTERVEAMLGFAKITAPFDGLITARYVDTGALVNAGSSKVLDLVDASTIRLQIPVTELETALVQVGKPVKASIDAIGTKPIEGTISRIAYALDPRTRTMLAEVDLKNPDLKLHPGMYAMTKIAVEKHDNALLIPVTGLVMEKTSAFVFKHAGGKAVKTAITIGFNDGVNVEVLTGIDKDTIVLLPDKVTLTPDQPVTVK